MPDYTPEPEHKFAFGLCTAGNIGCDRLGDAMHDPKSQAESIHLSTCVDFHYHE